MVRPLDALFDGWANFRSLTEAARRAVRGKRGSWAPAAFMVNLERECLRLERQLQDGSWWPGGYVTFRVTDTSLIPRMTPSGTLTRAVVPLLLGSTGTVMRIVCGIF